MADTYRIMSQNAASQVYLINKGDFKVMILALTSQLEQTVGNFENQIGSLGKKGRLSVL